VHTDYGKGLNDTDAEEEVVNGGVIKRRKADGKEIEEGRKVKAALHGKGSGGRKKKVKSL
jgi:hypothetical protein